MADLQVKREEELALYNKRISGASNFQKAIRFADENYRKVLEGYDQEITVRLEKEKKERIYQKGTAVITGKISIPSSDILVVAKNLDSMNGYKDSSEIAQKCRNLAVERIRKRLRCALLFYIADWLTLSEEEAEFEHEKEAFCKEELLRIEGNIQELTAQQASLGIFAILKKKEIENKLVKLREERDALSNGITKIPSHSQWMVIQEEPNRVLILKKECVGLERYHANSNSYLDSVTWQTCTLRQWLKDFYTHTFTEEQKAQILEIDVPIDRSQHEKGDAAHVRDKIFLLSTSEAERYLTTDTRRKTDVSGSWWLRSNFGPRHAVYVDGGQIMPYGKDVSGILGVRPALWLNLK
jgi:hypothetical protein